MSQGSSFFPIKGVTCTLPPLSSGRSQTHNHSQNCLIRFQSFHFRLSFNQAQRNPSAMYLTPIILVLVLLLHTASSSHVSCYAEGTTGHCMHTSDCGGKSVQNLCPGDYYNQCCIIPPPPPPPVLIGLYCDANGRKGTCQYTFYCGHGLTSIPNYCPGPPEVQCCAF